MRALATALVLTWLGCARPAAAQEIALESPRRPQWGYLGPGIASTALGVGLTAGMAVAIAGTACLGCSGPRQSIEVPVFLGTAAVAGFAVGVPLITLGVRGVRHRPGAPPFASRSAYMGAGIATTVIGTAILPVVAIFAMSRACVTADVGSSFGSRCSFPDQAIPPVAGLSALALGHFAVGIPMIVRAATLPPAEPAKDAVQIEAVISPTQLGFRGTF